MKKLKPQSGFVFTEFIEPEKEPFDRFFEIFKEIITYTSGDLDEALDWLAHLDKEYKLSTDDYNLDDFIADLKKRGFLKDDDDPNNEGGMMITAKTERAIRKNALNQIFGKLRKSGRGNHNTKHVGDGSEQSGEFRNYVFGDSLSQIAVTESIKNAQINN